MIDIKKISGFTLIELLIVVAIIAILAAIAIPNFLAAQVRAKIAHDVSGHVSLATALESYRVDYNDYPEDYNPSLGNIYGGDITLYVLTTPVAYITSVPTNSFFYMVPYTQYQTLKGKTLYYGSRTIDYWVNIAHVSYSTMQGSNSNSRWMLSSPGPTGDIGGWDLYDPSNGTVSHGQINRWGP